MDKTTKELEPLAHQGGFADVAELQSLTELVDLTQPGMAERFLWWGCEDGTKAGLLRLARGEETT